MAVTDQLNINGIEREVSRLSAKIDKIDASFGRVESQVDDMKGELAKLRHDFVVMVEEQRRSSALEQAATELVGVRQEMEKKFGNYGVVRNTMVGILQATDVALVRKTTISTVSEELMISTPDYWLAPVLVALAAWINNNRDLAERAIREAVRRDNEHTSLAMALICRRNHRTQTCFEWLARYFSTQDGARIDADSMVYIDAYINGIFGTDEKHLCDDYMLGWIRQVQDQTPEFEDMQRDSWAEYFESYEKEGAAQYPALKAIVREFGYIDKYLSKANAVEEISNNFKSIKASEVDHRTLAERVDAHLMLLVNSDDPDERELRSEEEYLLAVKAYGGDVRRARKVVNQRAQERRHKTVSIVEQMTRAVRDRSGNTDPYKKKTAMQFLGGYINEGFNAYRDTNTPEFPQQATLDIDEWSGVATTGDEASALQSSYTAYLAGKKQEEVTKLTNETNSRGLLYAAIGLGVVGLIFLFAFMPLGVVALVAAVFCFVKMRAKDKEREEGLKEIDERYAKKANEGCGEITLALGQWKAAKTEAAQRGTLLKLDKVA